MPGRYGLSGKMMVSMTDSLFETGPDDRDIVIGYPNMDEAQEDDINKLFGGPDGPQGVSQLNDTGTGPCEEPDTADFIAMISPSSRSMSIHCALNWVSLLFHFSIFHSRPTHASDKSWEVSVPSLWRSGNDVGSAGGSRD